MRVWRSVGVAAAVVLAILLVTAEAWIPLGHKTVTEQRMPPFFRNGGLEFHGASILIGESGPEWLLRSIDDGSLHVRLRFASIWPQQAGPARIFAISNTADDANLVVGQDDLDLVVRVRRDGSDAAGDPAVTIRHAVTVGEVQDLQLAIDGRRMVITLDSKVVKDVLLDDEPDRSPLSMWDPSQRALIGDELAGGTPWRGRLVEATVGSHSESFDLLAPAAARPGAEIVEYQKARMIDRPSDTSALGALLRVALFVPLGVAAERVLRRRALAMATCAAIVLLLAAGKRIVPDRHPSMVEIVLGLVGSAAGIALSSTLRRPTRPSDHSLV